MSSTWRLLISPAAHGSWNMAVDEAVLESAVSGASLPTLRLYSWNPPCLSLGFAQPLSDVDLPRLRALGWEVVRRPTGGRAVLHTDELTYSVAGPQDEPRLAGSVLESYNRLAGALVTALQDLGLQAEIQENVPASGPRSTSAVCFDVPSSYEIKVAGKKLIGSAQARRRGGVLQHGSLPLTGDLGRIVEVLSYPDQASRQRAAGRLDERATTVEAALGRAVCWDKAARALSNAFQSVLDIELIPGTLLPTEEARARELADSRYTHPEWNRKPLHGRPDTEGSNDG
jgi:lipoate-protein ligase A